jgi:hypothetical protein
VAILLQSGRWLGTVTGKPPLPFDWLMAPGIPRKK